ncbi:hypothetical protein Tsubulata_042628 [Turnera subulata]|uniref:Agenet domain-containing protein n=1 Tax=Turnera subulata TaxID=218843 RepID=A0A9Q0FY85_9ROSI|nr:hypothetical protein Tsubulata_042628 [Turnera subulata]
MVAGKKKGKKKGKFSLGSEVEVSWDIDGFRGAWFRGKVLRLVPQNKKRRHYMVRFKSLLNKEATKPLEEATSSKYIRPLPPPQDPNETFEVSDVVDAYHNDGWWRGIIHKVSVLEENGQSSSSPNYTVFFQSPAPELRMFSAQDLRRSFDWVDGKWVPVPKQMPNLSVQDEIRLQLKDGEPNADGLSVCEMNLEDQLSEGVEPRMAIVVRPEGELVSNVGDGGYGHEANCSAMDVVELPMTVCLESTGESAVRESVSGQMTEEGEIYTGTVVDSVAHADEQQNAGRESACGVGRDLPRKADEPPMMASMEPMASITCTAQEQNTLGVKATGMDFHDRATTVAELTPVVRRSPAGTVVDSVAHADEQQNAGRESACGVDRDLPRKADEPPMMASMEPMVEEQSTPGGNATEINFHDLAELAIEVILSPAAQEQNTLGVKATGMDFHDRATTVAELTPVVRRSPAEDTDLLEEPEWHLVKSPHLLKLWNDVESLEAFQLIPHTPHFKPLANSAEERREAEAIAKMVTFNHLVLRARDLKVDDDRSSFEKYLDALSEVAPFGFDVERVEVRVKEMLKAKVSREELQDEVRNVGAKMEQSKMEKLKLEESVGRIMAEKSKVEVEVEYLTRKLTSLRKKIREFMGKAREEGLKMEKRDNETLPISSPFTIQHFPSKMCKWKFPSNYHPYTIQIKYHYFSIIFPSKTKGPSDKIFSI